MGVSYYFNDDGGIEMFRWFLFFGVVNECQFLGFSDSMLDLKMEFCHLQTRCVFYVTIYKAFIKEKLNYLVTS